ncbi:radical SAM/SPASM domain-containing protein [Leisingera sp. M523]|uniref:radical SAM/SPASM domain-containing protein n=1 Tax=Leisingera sp. M523 TaxID=2867013 RepID=UPI0021A6A7FB|nr:radical SAM protein [Leisingera sp. M523]UWQ28145.1 radical SAM protein [Leisingera sp. M523]
MKDLAPVPDLKPETAQPDLPAKPPALHERALHMLARLLPLAYFRRPPKIIIIDATNSCNLRCPVCPVTFAMQRKRGMMKPNVFRKIIDDFKDQREKPAIYFSFSGEPTLHKDLPDFIAYAHENGHDTYLSTNATRLTPDMSERLIRSGLARVNLCMDGFSKQAQETYRVNSDFDKVKASIEEFLNIKKDLGFKTPVTVLQTLLTSYSEPQMDEMEAWARNAGFDRVRFKTFSIGSYTSDDQKREFAHFLPRQKELRRHPRHTSHAMCTVPLFQSVVFWNGDLGLCCIDYDQVIQLPNVEQDGFLAAYRSDEAAGARKRGFLKQFGICKTCSFSNAENMGIRRDLKK